MPPRAHRLVFGVSIFFIASAAVAASAEVRDARVAKGAATIFGQGTGNVTIYQSTDRAVIDWRGFKIAGDETLRLVQPNVSSVTLIRVAGGVAAAQIDGAIGATGGVFIVDRKGVFLGRSARIRAGGFLATTHDTADRDFMKGRNNFALSGEPSASIVNLGNISASPGGYVALVGAGVRNGGTIAAEHGSIAAAAATRFELDVGGRNLVELSSDERIANDVVDPDRPPLSIKVSGRITTLGASNGTGGGTIRISGEDVALAGARLDASAQSAGDGGQIVIRGTGGSRIDGSLILADGAATGRGGFIETSGRSLALSHSSIGAKGSGRWLLDPVDLIVDR
ncbi:MAG: filamentous hemagglutinin N-terminal domain-containing protein, partial [Stellaceae bacterium]